MFTQLAPHKPPDLGFPYRQLNWAELAGRMRKPAWLFDARAVADPAVVRAAGLTLWRVGDGEG